DKGRLPLRDNGFDCRLVADTPFIVQTDAHDVVGRAPSLRGDRPHPKAAERLLSPAEVHVEIFEFGAPAAAEGSFDAAARGPSSPQIAERADSGDAGDGDRRTILD